jgi:uncharacterized Zn finger protein (UPF0148 family)
MEVSIPLDSDGYLDRECPHEECESEFKVFADDLREKVCDEGVFCPVCGHTADSGQWYTQNQEEHLTQIAMREAMNEFDNFMHDSINQHQPRNGFGSVSIKYTSSALPIVMPIEAAELMLQRYDCEKCGCRYAAVGAAFFCPACGHNSARSAFEDTMQAIRKTVKSLNGVRTTLEDNLDRDTAANTIRHILEGSLVKIVASFQRFAEATFQALPAASKMKLPRNVFQRLDDSSQLWKDAIGKRYEDMLSRVEWTDLQRLFQQRHILEHQDGVVDQRYIEKLGDTTYQSGQRLVIKPDFILYCCDLVSKLA